LVRLKDYCEQIAIYRGKKKEKKIIIKKFNSLLENQFKLLIFQSFLDFYMKLANFVSQSLILVFVHLSVFNFKIISIDEKIIGLKFFFI
jgi:ABC-type uncharacterized transport system fused permease/ATPase subunit